MNETSLEPEEVLNSTLYKAPVDPAEWFGVRKDTTVLGYSKVRFTHIGFVQMVLNRIDC